MESAAYHVCAPMTAEHKRGMQWLASLAHAVQLSPVIGHALKSYGAFAETGDSAHLQRCEDFLRYEMCVALEQAARRRP